MLNLTIFAEESGAFSTPEGIDTIIVNFFNGLGWWGNLILIVLSLLLATIFGGIIGLQREINGHAAGFRTHVLIALATALIMVLSIYGIPGSASRDPMRLASAGVTGAGFIGAGCIIKNGSSVRGLTTSATIWLVTAIGLCCGAGFFVVGAITTLLSIVVLIAFGRVDRWIGRRGTHIVILSDIDSTVLSDLLVYLDKYHISYRDIDSNFSESKGKKVIRTHVVVSAKHSEDIDKFMEDFKENVKPLDITRSKT
ncbi:MAG: MgtC/SapB family protein [Coprobacillus sp.]|nr:MgtC/SapB family protein [Coprobacillus sp.]